MSLQTVLFGDNQFFGVNHMSEEKARALSMKFRDTKSIMRVLDDAYDAGIRVFMCTTYDRIAEIAEIVRNNPDRYPDFEFYPCMPYAHKYANSVGEVGILETLKRFSPSGILDTMFTGAMSVLTQDVNKMLRMLVDTEMKAFQGVKTPVIFLQNVITDLILGVKGYQFLVEFHRYIQEKYNAEAGFITMNLPLLLKESKTLLFVRILIKSGSACAAGLTPTKKQSRNLTRALLQCLSSHQALFLQKKL